MSEMNPATRIAGEWLRTAEGQSELAKVLAGHPLSIEVVVAWLGANPLFKAYRCHRGIGSIEDLDVRSVLKELALETLREEIREGTITLEEVERQIRAAMRVQ